LEIFSTEVDVKDRRVKMYTNEAGFDVFQTALKQDALNSGLTFTADSETDLCKVKDSTLLNFAFDAMVT
jgi:hypothetical protein